MYEALLKATPEYQKSAASFAKPGPAALFGLPPAGRALLYAALQKDLGRVLCIVTPGEAEATHFADDLKAVSYTHLHRRWALPGSARPIWTAGQSPRSVSYTHLDVYKRQPGRISSRSKKVGKIPFSLSELRRSQPTF